MPKAGRNPSRPAFGMRRVVRGAPIGRAANTESRHLMSIGFGIFLFAVGAICAFALNVDLGWIDIKTVGYILMGAGVIITIIGIALLARRRSVASTTRSGVDPVSGERVTRSETSAPEDPRV